VSVVIPGSVFLIIACVRNCYDTELCDGHTIIVAHKASSATENWWWLVSVSSMHGAWQREQRFSFSSLATATISESDLLVVSDSESLSESDASDGADLALFRGWKSGPHQLWYGSDWEITYLFWLATLLFCYWLVEQTQVSTNKKSQLLT